MLQHHSRSVRQRRIQPKQSAGTGAVYGSRWRIPDHQQLRRQQPHVLPARPRPDGGKSEPPAGAGQDLDRRHGAALAVRCRCAAASHTHVGLLQRHHQFGDRADDDAGRLPGVLQRIRDEPDLRSEQPVLQAPAAFESQRILVEHECALRKPGADQDLGHRCAARLERRRSGSVRDAGHDIRERERELPEGV